MSSPKTTTANQALMRIKSTVNHSLTIGGLRRALERGAGAARGLGLLGAGTAGQGGRFWRADASIRLPLGLA